MQTIKRKTCKVCGNPLSRWNISRSCGDLIMLKQECKVCRIPLQEIIPNELYRCGICGLYHHVRAKSTLPSLKAQAGTEAKPSSLTGEMKVFAERVISALCPPEKAYAPVIVREVKNIYDVIEGKADFEGWFTKVRQLLSLKNYQLAKVLYDCLEGLRTREARQLREEWYSFIQAEMKGYGIAWKQVETPQRRRDRFSA